MKNLKFDANSTSRQHHTQNFKIELISRCHHTMLCGRLSSGVYISMYMYVYITNVHFYMFALRQYNLLLSKKFIFFLSISFYSIKK